MSMPTVVKTRAIGGSLVVTIPRELVKSRGIAEGELIEVEIKKHQRDFFGSLKGVGVFSEEDELKGQLE